MRTRIAIVALAALIATGCTPFGSTATTAPADLAENHEQFLVAACAAFDALDAAIGNPDTGSGSELSKALDRAVEAGDVPTANRLADQSVATLEAGRRQLAIAGGWKPGSAMAAAADRFFVAAEAFVNGKRAGAATRDVRAGQTAFEEAGGLEAWQAMLGGASSIQLPPGTSPKRCPNVAIQL